MFTQIKLKNFKIFKDETCFPLANINLLTGINGKGKSSFLQSLLLMRQSIEQDENTSQIYLNGGCVRLGSFEDIKNIDSASEKIEITFSLSHPKLHFSFDLAFLFLENPKNHSLLDLGELLIHSDSEAFFFNKSSGKTARGIKIYKSKDNEFPYFEEWLETDILINKNANLNSLHRFFYLYIKRENHEYLIGRYFKKLNEIHHISADRIGPRDFYLKENLGKFINVGSKGEMTANVLSLKKDDLVNDALYIGKDAKSLVQQTEEWLKEIFGDAKFTIDDSSREVIYMLFNTKPNANRYKPANVGFGYSYALPIIVSGLIAQEGEILIVENPEAHLHPRAQSKLMLFLSKVASTGVQVFIESHSEHILNALRIAVKDQEIKIGSEDVRVLYFHESETSYFTHIPIKPNGKIENWPDGFFDQTEKDLDKLYQ
ncbi:MAG: DUF3696 domain-containing protein [Microscillaceae bacterium]|nr:DUF3696 domain-containing protein [Microscillaceae bacterium]